MAEATAPWYTVEMCKLAILRLQQKKNKKCNSNEETMGLVYQAGCEWIYVEIVRTSVYILTRSKIHDIHESPVNSDILSSPAPGGVCIYA